MPVETLFSTQMYLHTVTLLRSELRRAWVREEGVCFCPFLRETREGVRTQKARQARDRKGGGRDGALRLGGAVFRKKKRSPKGRAMALCRLRAAPGPGRSPWGPSALLPHGGPGRAGPGARVSVARRPGMRR